MNMRSAAFVIGAMGSLGLTVCDNSGIAGGGGGGAGGGAGVCVATCGTAVASGGMPCNGTGSSDAYQALAACACGTNGACNTDCGANFCVGAGADSACGTCLENSCGTETTDCVND